MGNQDWEKIETIIDQVLDLPREEQQRFVEKQCSDDPELMGRVTQLLKSIFDSEGWLEELKEHKYYPGEDVADDIKALTGSNNDLTGQQVGSYTIKKQIGKGGMGSVYLAERTDGEFDHRVAIKIIRQGHNTHKNILRFRREQQILAGLNHPGIGRLYDGGITDDGFPYIIMEYVDGIPIDEYCLQHNCSVDEKIELFKQVLEAVRYAHENLVIHRDLKPGNILVDGSGNIKILDFGISKLLEDEEDTSLTQTGARLLTPKYAAPEQIRQKHITTSCDLYALGMVFYKLLAGILPFDFAGCSGYKVEQTILHKQPPAPSKKVKNPNTENQLKGDLDAIVLKAIRKNPEERYRGITELLDDIRNYQENMPVNAQKGSTAYRISKFFKRHKTPIAVAVTFLLLIFSIAFYYTNQIAKERDRAKFEAQKATEIQEFLVDIFRYNNPDAKEYAGKDLTAQELLQAGLSNVENELQYHPETQIGIMISIGAAFRNLDELEDAEEAIKMALEKSKDHFGMDDMQTASIYTSLAKIKRDAGEYEKSDELINQAIEINETIADTALKKLANKYSILAYNQAYKSKYHKSEELFNYTDSLYIAADASNSLGRYNSLSNFAEVKVKLGEYEKALKYNKKALDFYRELYDGDHINIATALNKIGNIHQRLGNHEQADEYYRQSLDMKLQLLDEDNTSVAISYQDIAINLRIMGRYAEAEKFAQKDLEIMEEVYDEDHIKITPSLNIVGLVKRDLEEYEEAEELFERIIAIKENYYEKELPTLAASIYNLAHLYQTTGRYEEAYAMYKRVVDIDKNNLGPEHPEVAVDLNKLGDVSREMEAYSQADSIFSEAKPIFMDAFPNDHYRVAEHLVSHGQLKLRQKQFEEAQKDFERAADIFKENFGEDDTRVEETLSYLEKAKKATINR
ncbi:serine/threonine-protein kinase [Fodinibius sp. Rm-B-1B1-1]|uniref:serine/threonine-protein kinase n=1 Tax=Fodinibius alkaliphilus TaxID=3140241 RepID=UPI00315AA56E